jgi:hypothetical protein
VAHILVVIVDLELKDHIEIGKFIEKHNGNNYKNEKDI